MSISEMLTDLCVIRQKAKLKNTFENIVYNALLVKSLNKS